jgi:hypothetical protein
MSNVEELKAQESELRRQREEVEAAEAARVRQAFTTAAALISDAILHLEHTRTEQTPHPAAVPLIASATALQAAILTVAG